MNQDNFYEIYGYWHIPWWQNSLFKYLGWGITFLLLSGLIFVIIYRYKGKKILKPWEKAIQQLNKLKIEAVEANASKAYTKLIDIVKNYGKERFGFSLSLTENELQEKIADIIQAPLREKLNEVIIHATQAKYASAAYLFESIQQDIETVLSFVSLTMPIDCDKRA